MNQNSQYFLGFLNFFDFLKKVKFFVKRNFLILLLGVVIEL